jgi:phage shock protein A
MAESDNLVLEHLRHIRARVDQIADDMDEVKSRLVSLERTQAGLFADKADTHDRYDRLARRIERIERRLELTEP